jgi:hypothetical protein
MDGQEVIKRINSAKKPKVSKPAAKKTKNTAKSPVQ